MAVVFLVMKVSSSASVNEIWQCGLGSQKLHNGKKRDLLSRMRPKCGPNLELLRTSSRNFHQHAMKSLNSTFCDKSAMLFIMEGMLYKPISQDMHALILVLTLIDILSPFFTASLPLFFHDWENETFCVKCSLNADHFISMVRMRTKSAIADFYRSSA